MYLVERDADASEGERRRAESSLHAIEARPLNEVMPVRVDDSGPDDQRQRDEEQNQSSVRPRHGIESPCGVLLAAEPARPSTVPEVLNEDDDIAESVYGTGG